MDGRTVLTVPTKFAKRTNTGVTADFLVVLLRTRLAMAFETASMAQTKIRKKAGLTNAPATVPCKTSWPLRGDGDQRS